MERFQILTRLSFGFSRKASIIRSVSDVTLRLTGWAFRQQMIASVSTQIQCRDGMMMSFEMFTWLSSQVQVSRKQLMSLYLLQARAWKMNGWAEGF